MNRSKLYFFCSLTATAIVGYLLVTGSSYLTIALDNEQNMPLGTFITWAGIISLPLALYWGIAELRKPTKTITIFLAGFLKTLIVLGILWVPLSYLLAGNFAFTFSEKEAFQGGQTAMKWFWRLSYGIIIGVFLTLCTYWISLLFKEKIVINDV